MVKNQKDHRLSLRLDEESSKQLDTMLRDGQYKNMSSLIRDLINFNYAIKQSASKIEEHGVPYTIVFSLKDNQGLTDLVKKHQIAIDVPEAVRMCVKEYLTMVSEGKCPFIKYPQKDDAQKDITTYISDY